MSPRVVTTLCVILLSSCGTAAAMREPRVAMRIERRPDGFRAKPTPPIPPAPDAPPAPTPNGGLGPAEDRVVHLPGYGAPPAPQYSGFLDASAAEPGTKLHYWFAQAEVPDAATRPTVLWLNGGQFENLGPAWYTANAPSACFISCRFMQSFFLFLFIKNIKSTNYLCRNQASQGLDKIRHFSGVCLLFLVNPN